MKKIAFIITLATFTINSQSQINVGKLKDKASKQVNEAVNKKTETDSPNVSGTNKEVATPKKNGKGIYVSIQTGSNQNSGTEDAPYKNLDKALKEAGEYDKIHVAEGIYSGTFDVGYFEITKPVEIYAGYTVDFSSRNPLPNHTLIQTIKGKATSGKQAIIYIDEVSDVIIDGLIIDMGEHNDYAMKDIPEGLTTGYLGLTNQGGTPQRAGIKLAGNNITLRNNVFVNISYGGVFIMQRMKWPGKIHIDNNVFVNCSQAGIEGSVLTSADTDKKEIEISNNTFAFTYGTTFLNDILGYALWVKGKAKYNVHHNVFAFASDAALRYYDTDDAELYLDNNLFMNNRKNDVLSRMHNNPIFVTVEEFGDADFVKSVKNNKRMTENLPLNKAHVREFINMAAEVSMEYDPNADWNQVRSILGLPQQATGTAKITFFANKYDWKIVGSFWCSK